MTAFTILAAQGLLLLTMVSVRPAGAAATRMRLLLQGVLLCGSLLGRLAAGGGGALALACLAAGLLEIALVHARTGRWQEPGAPAPAPTLWPVAACVLLSWLAFRLLPGAPLAAVSFAIVLCGLAGSLRPRDERALWTSLLHAGHGVLLFVGTVPGPGWPGLLLVLPLQAVALSAVCRRPVWSDAAEPGAG